MQSSVTITLIICITVLGVFAMLMSIARQANNIDANKFAAEAAREMQKLMLMAKDGRNVKDPAQTLSDEGNNEYESEVTLYAAEEDDENYNF